MYNHADNGATSVSSPLSEYEENGLYEINIHLIVESNFLSIKHVHCK